MNPLVSRSSRIESRDSEQVTHLNFDSSIYPAAATIRAFAIFVVTYTLAYRYVAGFSENAPAPLWIPDSVLLCALLLIPRQRWLWLLVLGFAVRIAHAGVAFWFIGCTYLNDCLKAVLAAHLLRRVIPGRLRLNSLKQFGFYISIAVIATPALSALAGAATRLPLGSNFWHSFIQWYLGDATAALALTPTLLYWCQGGWSEVKAHVFRFAALIASTAGLLYYIFFVAHSEFSPAVLYAPAPVLILAATTFRPVAVSSAISLLALVSIISTAQGRGPFHVLHSHDAVLSMQLFLITVAGPMLFVAILIEERQTVENELRDKQNLLKERHGEIHDLAGRLLSAQEDERKKIARELHDDVSQRIAMLAISLEELSERFPPGMDTERALTQNLLNDTQDLSADVHELSRQLHSSMLEHTGLEASLRSLCRATSQKHRITVELHSEGASGFSADVNLCLFRVAQEAVNNAIKHGGAQQIDVLLRKQKDRLCLRVRDNGKGFDTARRTSGLGLVSMRERLRFLGGTLELKSESGLGTELYAELPLSLGSDLEPS